MSRVERPVAHVMPDGRLRLTHGPIDLIVSAEGDRIEAAYRRAETAFGPVLSTLAAELPRLRSAEGPEPDGLIARQMVAVVGRFGPVFVTPMAAVAGAVADHVLRAILVPGHGLTSLHVNNGGDIALWTSGPVLRVAVCDDPVTGTLGARAAIGPGDSIGGVATSGWRGRSHSLGIADAVTVLAETAALADAAATLIANAVDLPGHPGVTRVPAHHLSPDSDLGTRLVTTNVARLPPAKVAEALSRGQVVAQDYVEKGLIRAAYLSCQGARRMVGGQSVADEGSAGTQRELNHA
ncbi:UPF0280 family protein [Tropicibacter sp. S64]|uniref:UPF0280 family protein n=1 Tax=Tropicibacter sp. S64 TaxID=3415122 RepID=UPI003C7C5CB1